MIVKNESHVIRRCLESVAPFIDSWVISDTGSSDDTREIIQAFFAEKGIDGELLNNVWQDFATNRNYSLVAARQRADYVLVLDADEFLQCPQVLVLPA